MHFAVSGTDDTFAMGADIAKRLEALLNSADPAPKLKPARKPAREGADAFFAARREAIASAIRAHGERWDLAPGARVDGVLPPAWGSYKGPRSGQLFKRSRDMPLPAPDLWPGRCVPDGVVLRAALVYEAGRKPNPGGTDEYTRDDIFRLQGRPIATDAEIHSKQGLDQSWRYKGCEHE